MNHEDLEAQFSYFYNLKPGTLYFKVQKPVNKICNGLVRTGLNPMTFLVLKFIRRIFLLRWGSNFMSQEYTDSPLVLRNKHNLIYVFFPRSRL